MIKRKEQSTTHFLMAAFLTDGFSVGFGACFKVGFFDFFDKIIPYDLENKSL